MHVPAQVSRMAAAEAIRASYQKRQDYEAARRRHHDALAQEYYRLPEYPPGTLAKFCERHKIGIYEFSQALQRHRDKNGAID